MRLFGDLAKKGLAVQPEPRLDLNFFIEFFKRAQTLAPFTFEKYPPSGGGETQLYRALQSAVLE
jgi:hypothetical protein